MKEYNYICHQTFFYFGETNPVSLVLMNSPDFSIFLGSYIDWKDLKLMYKDIYNKTDK